MYQLGYFTVLLLLSCLPFSGWDCSLLRGGVSNCGNAPAAENGFRQNGGTTKAFLQRGACIADYRNIRNRARSAELDYEFNRFIQETRASAPAPHYSPPKNFRIRSSALSRFSIDVAYENRTCSFVPKPSPATVATYAWCRSPCAISAPDFISLLPKNAETFGYA